MFAKIHCTWKEIRPDLTHPSEESREALLSFTEAELKLTQLGSLSELTNAKLSRLIESLVLEQQQPRLAGCQSQGGSPAASRAEVSHLASKEQVWAIKQILNYLGWTVEFRAKFIRERYRCESPSMLTSRNAKAMIRILLNVASARDLKSKLGNETKVSKPMIVGYLPTLKAKLGMK
jgi:hypothetical protein